MTIASALLDWYDQNARELPWRRDKDPYKIWVSEIMLQQTRVEAVKEYYERWIKRFPQPEDLARAAEQEVLGYWQGLGYYSRARNLLSGVREVCAVYGGKVPDEEKKVQALPGIGEYTAGAILSIAYNQRTPAVDGNVLRIFSRLFCLQEDILKASTKRQVYLLVKEHMDPARPGDFNQALMDLGAMVCVPKRPRCGECPLTSLCEAYARDVQDILPLRTPKKAPVEVVLAAALLERKEVYLVRQRPDNGLLAGMWEFPAVEVLANTTAEDCLKTLLLNELGLEVSVGEREYYYVHTFSHRKWHISFYRCRQLSGRLKPEQGRWFRLESGEELPWAGPHRKAADALRCAMKNGF
ncbi:hypothetical protein P22_3714 [Propionispora sp. 2/2-37]|uniref:A/G-specific adenine glycosylase n=1 Tax=Propionispora sp. 2/2-37 TaxID=1677858 RepID=UPI0006BB67C3|nr:A/G-specific adenine glycosylase [Propionispora sp. 2/2-37]CUH97583.1 hypothetical protein P22_3714 [Propionispora sp. 2/2-37]